MIYDALTAGRLRWVGLADRGAGVFDDIVLGLHDRIAACQVKTSRDPESFTVRTMLLGAEKLWDAMLKARRKLAAEFPGVLIETVYDGVGVISNPVVRLCQKTIAKAARKAASQRQKAREKCNNKELRGEASSPCPDAVAAKGLGKVVAKLTLLVEKKYLRGGTPVGHLEDLAVHPDHRRRGIGSALVRHVADEAKKLGCGCLLLRGGPEFAPFFTRLGCVQSEVGLRWDL